MELVTSYQNYSEPVIEVVFGVFHRKPMLVFAKVVSRPFAGTMDIWHFRRDMATEFGAEHVDNTRRMEIKNGQG